MITSLWGPVEREGSFKISGARYVVRVHVEGTCRACPSEDPERCEAFRCAIRRLIRHGGLPYLYRFSDGSTTDGGASSPGAPTLRGDTSPPTLEPAS